MARFDNRQQCVNRAVRMDVAVGSTASSLALFLRFSRLRTLCGSIGRASIALLIEVHACPRRGHACAIPNGNIRLHVQLPRDAVRR